MEIITIPLLFIIVLFGGHWFIYFSLSRFFAVQQKKARRILLAAVILMSAGFIGASFLSRAYGFYPVKLLYLLFSVWLGAAIYLIIIFCFAWLVFLLSRWAKKPVKKNILGAASLAVVALICVYGLVNAAILKVNQYEITINGLPAAWQGKTIVHLSDLHLGAINGPDYAAKIIEKANSFNPDYVFITGDYLDGSCPEASRYTEPLENLRAKEGVFFVDGNHEIYANDQGFYAGLEKHGITVLRNEIALIKGVQIAGIRYQGWEQYDNMEEFWQNISSQNPAIVLAHEPAYIKEAEAAGADLLLSGHSHRGQLFPTGLVTRLIYGPFHYGLHTVGGMAAYTSSGAGTWGPPMRVGTDNEVSVFRVLGG